MCSLMRWSSLDKEFNNKLYFFCFLIMRIKKIIKTIKENIKSNPVSITSLCLL